MGFRLVRRFGLYAALASVLGAAFYLRVGLARPPVEGDEDDEVQAVAGPLAPRTPGGRLLICGGGKLPDAIRDRFVELAGGPKARIVLIPTAGSWRTEPDPERVVLPWKKYEVVSIQLVHTKSRSLADDPAFVRPLTEATGVWFSGGRQQSLTEAYLGTEVERQLQALLARGGVIGGTSAGAAVMSRVMIGGSVRNGRDIVAPRLEQGFDLLPGVVLDQHFLKRRRENRLLGAVAQHPDLLGLGIDEQTALEVDVRSRRVRVLGNSYVVAYVPDPNAPPAPPPAAVAPRPASPGPSSKAEVDKALRAADTTPAPFPFPYQKFQLNPGDEADLAALKTLSEQAVTTALDVNAL